ncbi:MAG TPA: sucrose phosphorylase [Steroidobacteraceae bacterium]|nr:sucrose phosphorylase [Steroidobacteraceae bacterium]
MKSQVQLICYVDRLGGTLRGLRQLIGGPFAGLFGGVHILPFFHPIDGADAGFDPIDHQQVDERLGDWDDVRALAGEVDIVADVIVNHISSHSPQFLDYSAHGARSRYDGLFLTFESVFPDGASEADLLAIYRPRPGLPFTPLTLADGTRRLLWTTFTAEQLDIDVTHPEGTRYLDQILRIFATNGVKLIRLDAVGYAVKRAGTSCFMMEETCAFIREFAARAGSHGLEVLVEIHAHHQQQIRIASQVDWVYDFALPPLVLHAFFAGTARHLKDWIQVRPANSLTVLDTHDGIGVIDIGADSTDPAGLPGLVPDAGIDQLVQRIHANCHGESQRATGAAASNLDLYQVNCTFHDALGRDDLRYLLSRAIQFFLPGIPQVYYVGLLAGANDMALLARTGVGRDINRHHYTRGEIEEALRRPVVADLLGLIRLRNTHPAFQGSFELLPSPDDELEMCWRNDQAQVHLRVDLGTAAHELLFTNLEAAPQFRLLQARIP